MTYDADPRVDGYIEALPAWQQAICREVRDLVHAADPEVTETIKRSVQPYFVLQGNVCALLAAKDHVNVFLYDGAIVPDPDGHLHLDGRRAPAGEGDGGAVGRDPRVRQVADHGLGETEVLLDGRRVETDLPAHRCRTGVEGGVPTGQQRAHATRDRAGWVMVGHGWSLAPGCAGRRGFRGRWGSRARRACPNSRIARPRPGGTPATEGPAATRVTRREGPGATGPVGCPSRNPEPEAAWGRPPAE